MLRFAAFAGAAALLAAAAHAEPRDYADAARGFSMKVPEGWSDPAGGLVVTSADGAVRCTVTAQPVPQTAGKTQDQVNAAMQVYTADIWNRQFFAGGATGTVDHSGITRMEQYDAPWARGTITYPGSPTAKFGVLLIQAPGKLASVTCTGEPLAYDANLSGVTTVLNWLRPL